MSSIARRVALRHFIATDESLASSLSAVFRKKMSELHQGALDFSWDTKGGLSEPLGFKPGTFSFPAKPSAFPDNNLIGGLLIRGTYDIGDKGIPRSKSPARGTPEYDAWKAGGGSPEHEGQVIEAKLVVGYYHKKQDVGGTGKLDRITDLGSYILAFDAFEEPELLEDQDFSKLKSGVDACINDVLSDPPPEAASEAMTKEQKKKRDQKKRDEARAQKERDQAKLLKLKGEKQSEQKNAEREADRETHGSIDAFVKYITEEQDGVYGNADLWKLASYMSESGEEPGDLKKVLADRGLTFKAGFKAAFGPQDLAFELRDIAFRIESAVNPSRSAVAMVLEELVENLIE